LAIGDCKPAAIQAAFAGGTWGCAEAAGTRIEVGSGALDQPIDKRRIDHDIRIRRRWFSQLLQKACDLFGGFFNIGLAIFPGVVDGFQQRDKPRAVALIGWREISPAIKRPKIRR